MVNLVDTGHDNVLLFTYFNWKACGHLLNSYFPEWNLGVCILIVSEPYLFAYDSNAILVGNVLKDIKKIDRTHLMKAFSVLDDNSIGRINRISFINLDLSERAIRSQTTRTFSYENTFTDLSDPSFVPTSATGFVGLRQPRARAVP